ncbi:unnamed protein product [Penicillium nalgiovense]|nr:unnamed protein product [Penicillium nalgiovense]
MITDTINNPNGVFTDGLPAFSWCVFLNIGQWEAFDILQKDPRNIGIFAARLTWVGNRHNSGCKEFWYVGALNLLQVAIYLDLCLVQIQHVIMKISFVHSRTPCTAFRCFTVVELSNKL